MEHSNLFIVETCESLIKPYWELNKRDFYNYETDYMFYFKRNIKKRYPDNKLAYENDLINRLKELPFCLLVQNITVSSFGKYLQIHILPSEVILSYCFFMFMNLK